MLFCDTREASKKKSFIKSLSKAVLVKEQYMTAGDWLFTAAEGKRLLLMEYKTLNDLAGSMVTHLWDQLTKMEMAAKENDYDLCILVEGNLWWFEKYRKWNIASFLRLEDSIWSDWKIPMQFTLNPRWSLMWMIAKAKDLDKPFEEKEFSMRQVKLPAKTPEEIAQRILEGVTGWGPKLAKDLLMTRGSVKGVVNSTKEELLEVKRISGKSVDSFIEAINCHFTKGKLAQDLVLSKKETYK